MKKFEITGTSVSFQTRRDHKNAYRPSRIYVDGISEFDTDEDRKALLHDLKIFLGKSVHGKVKFSRKADCSCGCSPGFIIDTDTTKNFHQGWQIADARMELTVRRAA